MMLSDSINPQMVTLARQAAGMTQIELGKAAGLAQATISKVEAGLLQLTGEEVARLTIALDFPVDFFFQNRHVPGPGLSEMFHRKRQRVGIKLLNFIHAEAAVRLMNLQDMLRSWELPDEVIPQIPLDDNGNETPEKVARRLRAVWYIPSGPVFSVTNTIEQFGGLVMPCRFGTRHVDGFSRRWDGMPPAFFVNASLTPDRWRWTLAHELGHMVIHGDVPDQPDKIMELQADQFAGEFLAPEYEIKPQLWNLTLPKLAGLKRYWKISIQALIMRAHRLEALTEGQMRYLFVQLSKAGYRLREPAELDPPAEPPTLVNHILEHHVRNLGYSEGELLGLLKIGLNRFSLLYTPGKPRLKLLT